MESNKIKMVDFEDTVLWIDSIISININSINYIEKYSENKMVFGLNSGDRYFVNASINNLNALQQFGLVRVHWFISNYPKKYGLLETKRLIGINQSLDKYKNKKGDKK